MVSTPRPVPGYLDLFEKYQIRNRVQIWTNKERDRFFTWYYTHGEIEAFDKRGNHLGAFHGITGEKLKDAVRGRKL